MAFPDTTVEGKLFNVDTKFSFIRSVKRFDHSYYKLSLNGNLGEISKCFEGTSLIEDVKDTINKNLEGKKPTWENITLQVQIIFKPHSNKARKTSTKEELEKAIERCNDTLKKIEDFNKEHPIPEVGEDTFSEQRVKKLKEYEDAYINKEEILSQYKASAEEVLKDAKDNYTISKIEDGKDRPNNRIWIIGFKVDFGDLLSSDNGAFKFKSFAVSFCYFGGEVSVDDQDSYKGKIDFIEGGDKSDEIFLKTQAIIEQNNYLQNLVLENILKTKTQETESEEDKLKKSLKARIEQKVKLIEDENAKKIYDEAVKNFEDKSFDELTMLSFQIYEASK